MNVEFNDLIVAFGLMLLIEGASYTLFTDQMKQMMTRVLMMPSGDVKTAGLIATVIGFLIVWFMGGKT